jgi:hypothetical protein
MRLPGNGSIRVKRKLNSTEVIDALTDLFILRGVRADIRSGNGPESIAEAVSEWIRAAGAETACFEPGSPLLGDRRAMPCRAVGELLNGEILYVRREAQVIIDHGGTSTTPSPSREIASQSLSGNGPHLAPGCRPPAPEANVPMDQRPIMH